MKNNVKNLLPHGFLWGTSSAAHQVEGETRENDWWHWAASGKVPLPGIGCDHYRLYEEDFLLMQRMHHSAHRFSIEWSRINPQEGEMNSKEIDHYKTVLLSLRNKHISSFVTLHHMTSPKWFIDKGGFSKKENLHYFLDFVSLCTKEFGSLVDFWITINEPTTYAAKSYLLGDGPPGEKNIYTAICVFVNLVRAHEASYRIIKRVNPHAIVGSSHVISRFSSDGGFFGYVLTPILHLLNNSLYLLMTNKTHDFVGVNYYYRIQVSLHMIQQGISEKDFEGIMRDERHDLGWHVDSKSMYRMLLYVWKLMKKPIYITEHGISDPSDIKRIGHIDDAVGAIRHAYGDGVDIRGYFHWTFLDNYEWSSGFRSKFGLVSVDPDTKKRTPKKSAKYFSSIIRQNGSMKKKIFLK